MRPIWIGSLLLFVMMAFIGTRPAQGADDVYWMKIRATDKFQRTAIANHGIQIENISGDYVVAFGSIEKVKTMESLGILLASYQLSPQMMDFPLEDAAFHNYAEVTTELQALASANPDFVALDSIGKTVEGRDIWKLRISTQLASARNKAGIVFMGGHHAREHLSVEIPLLLARHLIEQYRKGDKRIVSLVENRDIHIIPMVNPDGAEFDIGGKRYRMWRKNRAANTDGSFGVDLNRNYGYEWGTVGASNNPDDDTFMGPAAFSEPETRAIRDFLAQQTNLSTLLTFHTFSELILYPFGYTYSPVGDAKDLQVYKTMAGKMSQWNQYEPMQTSELYAAAGDTTDWAYGTHRIFSFTFELDPSGPWSGGFYPGTKVIPSVFSKNLEPCLYLMEYSDNPYRVLNKF